MMKNDSPQSICVRECDQSCGLPDRNYKVHDCCHGHEYRFGWCDGREATCNRKLDKIEALEWLAVKKPDD